MPDTGAIPSPRGPRATARRSRVRGAQAAALAVALVAACLAVPSAARADTGSQLASAQARLRTVLAKIRAQQAVVDRLQRQLNALAGRLSRIQSQIDLTQGRIAATASEITDVADRLSIQQAELNQRAVAAYEMGPLSGLEVLLGATSVADFEQRMGLLNAAAAADQQLIAAMRAARSDLSAKEADLQSLQRQNQRTREALASQQKTLDAKFRQQRSALADLGRARARAEALVKRLKKKQRAEAEQQLAAGGHGGIPGVFSACPVRGPHAYSDDFGAPRSTTIPPHPHGGNDIFAPRGTPIVAPFPGTAADVSGGLGGLAVAVYGPAGYVYNAHLERLGRLGSVSVGTVIGYVGNTGDAAGGPTHDHFEWHPNVIPPNPWTSPYGYSVVGTGIDPYPYLNSVC